jgi:hypothetical protein
LLNITYCNKNARDVENRRYRKRMNIISQILETGNNDYEEGNAGATNPWQKRKGF